MSDKDDLIERLRNYAKDWRDRAASKEIVEEAAAEIERLLRRLEAAEARELVLREALVEIERYASDDHVRRRARAALSTHEPVIT
jgi:N-acetylglucosamine kinase-like BadF-type ATPase